jgi:hypothetical protein
MKVFWVCIQKQGRFPQLIHTDFIANPQEALDSAQSYEGAKPEEILIGCWDTEDGTGVVDSLADLDTVKFLIEFGQ